MSKSKLFRRLISVVLAVVMLMSVIPYSMTVGAATSEHPDSVTITIVDQNGNAIQGASVKIIVDSVSNGAGYINETKITDAYGTVDVVNSDAFVNGDLTLSASVTKVGYSTGSIDSEIITSDDQNFSVVLTTTSITDVVVTATNEVYTGTSYPAASVSGVQQGDVVTYKLDDGDYQRDMPSIQEPGAYALTVRVERRGYDVFEQTVQSIVSLNTINLSVQEYKGFYDSEEHNALVVEGLLDTDDVEYILNDGIPSEEIPKITDVGSYKVTVNVKRYGYQDYTEVFNGVSIEAIDISGYSVVAYQGVYDGTAHDAVYTKCENPVEGDKIEYMLGESGTWTEEVPQISAAGSYNVNVRITRVGNNYKPTVLTAVAFIDRAKQNLEFKNASYYDGGSSNVLFDINSIYDFSAIDTATQSSDGITYSVNNIADGSNIASITADGKLSVKAPGCISVTASKAGSGNYSDVSIVYTLIITESAEQLVNFSVSSVNYVFGENSGNISSVQANKKYSDDNGSLTYSINKNDIGISCDRNSGKVLITDYNKLSAALEDGPVQLIVSVEKAVGTKTVQVQTKPEKPENAMTIYFSDSSNWGNVNIHYWGGSKETSFPGTAMEYVETNGYGQKVYKLNIPDDTKGIVFSNGSNSNQTVDITSGFGHNVGYYTYLKGFDGKWHVGSYNRPDGGYQTVEQQKHVYDSSSASYVINISTAKTPEDAYVLSGNMSNGWYISDVKVTPKDVETYMISTKPEPEKFATNVTISNQGSGDRHVYLKTTSGAITKKIKLEGLKIDTIAPDPGSMSIKYSEPNSFLELLSRIFKFYEPSATITFIVEDEVAEDESGLSSINWFYTKDSDATSSILADESGTLVPYLKDGKYVADLDLTASSLKQYRGNISFNATDIAGNKPDGVYNGKEVIVIDTINPVFKAEHKMVDPEKGFYKQDNDSHQYTGDVEFTFTIKEANFFKEHAKVSVKKDGKSAQPVDVKWTSTDEVHVGVFTLAGDGEYTVCLDYKDGSGNLMKDEEGFICLADYESELIIIDNTVASVTGGVKDQVVSFDVNERNFRPENLVVSGTIEDINGNQAALTVEQLTAILNDMDNWENDSSDYSYKFNYDFNNGDSYYEGIYDIKVDYCDVSGGNPVTFEPDTFIIDHTAPNEISIEYSTPISETILEVLTLGFYNPSVTVKFTAYDTYAGVDHFTWNYTKPSGESDINVSRLDDTNITAIQDDKDKSKFIAEITLTADEFKQYKGYIAVGATDKNNNVSNKITDINKIIVVDTIAPEMTVEYSQESRYYNSKYYYNGDITAKFHITEANFFEQDVKIIVSKNGVEEKLNVEEDVKWTHKNADEHIGELVLTGDGDYVIKVDYTDRSGNIMDYYESDVRVIDTIAPVIDVSYANNTPINTLKDSENNDRDYFDNTQIATIKITEKNFEKNEVDFSSVVSKDVAGLVLGNDSIKYSNWSDAGDEHVIVVTYNGDANYTFDMDYTDLATNPAKDYETDYFTVDKSDPVNLTISYSPSVLDTVLETISFGFYQSKAKVTITADDDTSPINEFVYNYTKSSGVSRVNAELLNQVLSEANITYSNGNKTATSTFEIPKGVLTNNTQFNGTVGFTAKDRAGNDTDKNDKKRIVVDNIAPVCEVTYNQHVNEDNGVYYFDGNINASVKITEANFYANDVNITVTKDGANYPVSPSWTDESVDVHIGTFTLSQDGDYEITVSYTDKSGNAMTTYESNQLTIDTQIEEPTYSINGVAKTDNGGAYKKNATVAFSFSDENYNTNTIKLTRTRFNSVEDVTSKFINVALNANGGSGSFSIPTTVENDGIYVLSIGMTDKALHSTESQIKFTINRYGSVYEYDENLMALIKDGGQYVTSVKEDLIITEYNAERILKDSLNILITRDGEAIDVEYKSNPAQIDSKVKIGSSGWYQYVYAIKASNFAQDGVYKISVTSAYATNDSAKNESTSVPENSIDKEGNQILDSMNFVVDSKAPEIRNIVNLEKPIVNAQSLDVKYTIVDVGGLKCIEVIVNGEVIDTITEFGDNLFNYSGQFTIKEQTGAQSVQFRVTDLAGNVTDTDAEDFSTGDLFVFNDTVTVSTNVFVRWYANKLLFWGSIAGIIALAAIVCLIIAKRKKNK